MREADTARFALEGYVPSDDPQLRFGRSIISEPYPALHACATLRVGSVPRDHPLHGAISAAAAQGTITGADGELHVVLGNTGEVYWPASRIISETRLWTQMVEQYAREVRQEEEARIARDRARLPAWLEPMERLRLEHERLMQEVRELSERVQSQEPE